MEALRKKKEPCGFRTIRLPLDVRKWLKRQAQRNTSSSNAEIIRSIRDRMDAERREARASAAS
jgi:hypothetical protein